MNLIYNDAMLCDFYEFTMGNGYLKHGKKDTVSCFDLYFRKVPDQGGFAIAAGLQSVIDYIKNLHFSKEDIDYLRSKKLFDEEFLAYLATFEFSCDVRAIPEGTPVFPNEPIVTVKGPAIQAQLLETMLLIAINHQSLIATKAHRIVKAAKGRPVFEFGSRRAQGNNAAILGARAAYIAGCAGTACAVCEQLYGIPAVGTMAHSWIQMFDSEYEAFRAYAEQYPTACTLLVDTYSVLKSGIPNAIRVHKEVLEPRGYKLNGIRIDSGDVAYLSKKARPVPAVDHLQERAGLWRRLQGGCRGRGRRNDPQDQVLRKRGKDHESLREGDLAPLLQHHGTNAGGSDRSAGRGIRFHQAHRAVPSRFPLEAQDLRELYSEKASRSRL